MPPQIKYELQEFERIMAAAEKPDTKPPPHFKEQLQTEVERIKRTFIHEVFHFDDERHLERYIQFHQQTLIGLLDKLAHQSQITKGSRKEYLTLIYTHLDLILQFIERHFVRYFDQDAKAPEVYLTIARTELAKDIDSLTTALRNAQADDQLLTVMMQVIQNMLDKGYRDVTFRQVMYAKEMHKELSLLATKESLRDINEELRQIMYYLNVNSVKAVTYHAHYISTLLDTATTRHEKIEQLSLVMKTISQAQVKPGIRYNLKAANLKDQLFEFINVEMDYQERLQRLNSPSPGSGGPISGFKLKFDASVAQLAYLIRIFLETKIIANTNLTHIIHFLAQFVVTKKSEALSFTSFRTKFYNVEDSTKQSVRTLLTTLIHHIDHS